MTDAGRAEELLSKLQDEAESVVASSHGSAEFCKWFRNAQVTIEKIFGKEERHISDWNNIEFVPQGWEYSAEDERQYFQDGVVKASAILQSFIEELRDFGTPRLAILENFEALDEVRRLAHRFHRVCAQLKQRHKQRATIEIRDEYDVQDLFHALLKIRFDDVRPEEHSPSYAGSASRLDFLLKNEKIVVEIKKSRSGLRAREVGQELIIDTRRYSAHPDCQTLVCFVYDPDGLITNPDGIERDLSAPVNGMAVEVLIFPKS